jgi:hypothetical protein
VARSVPGNRAFPVKAIWLALALGGLLLLGGSAADAYKIGSGTYRWPHPPLPLGAEIVDFSTIPYYDASAFQWSVDQAARSWNRARTGYRFERVSSPSDAAIIISGLRSTAKTCHGHAKPGFAPYPNRQTFIREFPRRVRLGGSCDRYLMVLVAAHEFGHILGLSDQNRRCALMNEELGTGGRFSTPKPCPTFPRRQWWRRPVRPDDIRGVKELFYNDVYDPERLLFPASRRAAG